MKAITILGATGSIGQTTLSVLEQQSTHYSVYALTANSNVKALFNQCLRYRPQFAVMSDKVAAASLSNQLRAAAPEITVLAGIDGLIQVASAGHVDVVMAAIVGSAGLLPTLAAVEAGKRVLLANKEPLVMAGHLIMQAMHHNGAVILPVDSEHNALFQCMPAGYQVGEPVPYLKRLLLTASGGPFRQLPMAELVTVTPQQACAHPNWTMGRKISVDSATMVNKGLEVIEARHLFALSAAEVSEKIQVVIHPQSIIHSMVEYIDGAVMAELSSHTMRIPIAVALAWPDRINSEQSYLDFNALTELNFEPVDLCRYPCLDLVYQAIKAGGTAPIILNAANEVAVAGFLAGQIRFTDIATMIDQTLERCENIAADNLALVLQIDSEARRLTNQLMTQADTKTVFVQ